MATDDTTPIGARVRAARVRQGMSLGTLAAATGLSKAHLSRIERGERSLDRRSTLQAIADALHTPVAALTGQPFTPRNKLENAAQAAALDIRDALIGTSLGERPEGAGRPVAHLNRELWRVERLKGACDYAGLGPLLPGLITDCQATVAGAERQPGLAVLVRCCVQVEAQCGHTGHDDLAWVAAERGHAAALLSEDPTLIAAATVSRGFALNRMGLTPRERALTLVTAAADELARHPTTGESAEVLGMLHLVAAYVHNGAGRREQAQDRLREAAVLAEYTGDGNAFDFWFGPANVGVWRVSMAVERGEGGAVADLASGVNDSVLPQSRRTGLLIGLGRALARERDRHREAVHAFLRAEALGSQRLHVDPFAREAIASLRYAAGGADLRGLADRMGVAC